MKAALIVDAPIISQKKIWIKKIQQPYFDHPFHYHQLCEITWIENGHGQLIVGDYIGNFYEGELIFNNAGLPHLWRCDQSFYKKEAAETTRITGTRAIAIYFPQKLVSELTDDNKYIALYNDLLQRANRGLRINGISKSIIISLINKMKSSSGLYQLGYFLQIIHTIIHSEDYEYLASMNYMNNYDNEDIFRFNNIYQFLLENFSEEITLNDAASVCNMSSNSFCRYFKSKTQKTFTRFLNEIRIGQACKLLQQGDKPILAICYECGYNSPVNFFKFFKQLTGQTPGEYRNNIKKLTAVQAPA